MSRLVTRTKEFRKWMERSVTQEGRKWRRGQSCKCRREQKMNGKVSHTNTRVQKMNGKVSHTDSSAALYLLSGQCMGAVQAATGPVHRYHRRADPVTAGTGRAGQAEPSMGQEGGCCLRCCAHCWVSPTASLSCFRHRWTACDHSCWQHLPWPHSEVKAERAGRHGGCTLYLFKF